MPLFNVHFNENITSFHMSSALFKNRLGLLAFGSNTQTDVCLQARAKGDENATTSFCLLLGAARIRAAVGVHYRSIP